MDYFTKNPFFQEIISPLTISVHEGVSGAQYQLQTMEEVKQARRWDHTSSIMGGVFLSLQSCTRVRLNSFFFELSNFSGTCDRSLSRSSWLNVPYPTVQGQSSSKNIDMYSLQGSITDWCLFQPHNIQRIKPRSVSFCPDKPLTIVLIKPTC